MKSARTPFTVSVPSLCRLLTLAVTLSFCPLHTPSAAVSETKSTSRPTKPANTAESAKNTVNDINTKTAMIFNIIRFTDWPYNSDEVRLCLLGSGEQAKALTVINGKEASGRTILIKPRISPEYMTRECDALFISDSAKQQLPDVLKLLKDNPVLTLSDMDQFAEQGGMIAFYKNDEDRIAFAINLDAVLNADLMVNSQILKLARIVDK